MARTIGRLRGPIRCRGAIRAIRRRAGLASFGIGQVSPGRNTRRALGRDPVVVARTIDGNALKTRPTYGLDKGRSGGGDMGGISSRAGQGRAGPWAERWLS